MVSAYALHRGDPSASKRKASCTCKINSSKLFAYSCACRAKPLQPSEWKQMLSRAQRIDPSADAAQAATHSGAGSGASNAADSTAADNATRSSKGNWRSLGGGAQPLAQPSSRQPDQGQGAASQSVGGVGDATQSSGAGDVTQSGGAGNAIQSSGSGDVVVLDVRNGYEWDAGHFQGAERPLEVCVFCRKSLH